MTRYVLRTLLQARGRLVLSVGGVALALALMLALDAIVGGTEARITAYIDHSGADVWVSQTGVRTMHMSASALPVNTVQQVRAVPGVASVTPILYVDDDRRRPGARRGLRDRAAARCGERCALGCGRERPFLPPAARSSIVGSRPRPAPGWGTRSPSSGAFIITGLSVGTANITSSVAVVPFADFARLRGGDQTVSYLLVRAEPHAWRRTLPPQSGIRCRG